MKGLFEIHGELFIETEVLVNLGVSYNTIKRGLRLNLNGWRSIPHIQNENRILLTYDSLRDRYKQLIQAEYGDPYEYVRKKEAEEDEKIRLSHLSYLSERVRHCYKEYNEISIHIRANGLKLDDVQAYQIARASAWLKFLIESNAKRLGFQNKRELLDAAAKLIDQEELHCLRTRSGEWLKKKCTAYRKEGWKMLIHGLAGKKSNRRKIEAEQEAFLLTVFADSRKFNATQVWTIYQKAAREKGWPMLSESSVRRFYADSKNKNTVAKRRHGDYATRSWLKPYADRKKPLPDDVWEVDGTKLELWYRDEKGRSQRRDFVVVLDAGSMKVVGWKTGLHESGHMVRMALRTAIAYTGHLPHEVVTDHGPGMTAGETHGWINSWSHHHLTAVGNSRGKIIEPWFRQFFQQILVWEPNYAGAGIKAKNLENKANTEVQKGMIFPDEATLEARLAKLIELWNAWAPAHRDREVPNRIYERAVKRRRILASGDIDKMERIWWVRHQRGKKKRSLITSTLTNGGIKFTLGGETITYEPCPKGPDVDDLEAEAMFFADHRGRKFSCKYDLLDPSVIALYDAEGKHFVTYAKVKEKLPYMQKFADDADKALIQRLYKLQRHHDDILDARIAEAESTAYSYPNARDTLVAGFSHEEYSKDSWNEAETAVKRREFLGLTDEPVQRSKQVDNNQTINLYGDITGTGEILEL